MHTEALLPHQLIKNKIDIPYNSVWDLFLAKELESPDKTFLISPGNKELTFKEFKTNTLKVIRYLKKFNLKKQDRVSLVIQNSQEFVLLYFGVLALGYTLVPINPDFSA